jgi:hypothetical protein
LLGPKQNVTPELMKEMQLDNANFLAAMALPVLADLVKTNDANMLDQLKGWEGKYVKESTGATFFEEWWNAIETETWGPSMRLVVEMDETLKAWGMDVVGFRNSLLCHRRSSATQIVEESCLFDRFYRRICIVDNPTLTF